VSESRAADRRGGTAGRFIALLAASYAAASAGWLATFLLDAGSMALGAVQGAAIFAWIGLVILLNFLHGPPMEDLRSTARGCMWQLIMVSQLALIVAPWWPSTKGSVG